MKVVKYSLYGAYYDKVQKEPLEDMLSMGYEIIQYKGISLANAIFYQVKEIIYPLPSYLSKSDWDFKN